MIREVVLDEIVPEEIRKTVYYARAHTQEFDVCFRYIGSLSVTAKEYAS